MAACHFLLTGDHATANTVGLNQDTGDAIDPEMEGIFDNYAVKRPIINSGPVIASQLLLVYEVIRAGRNMRKPSLVIFYDLVYYCCMFVSWCLNGPSQDLFLNFYQPRCALHFFVC